MKNVLINCLLFIMKSFYISGKALFKNAVSRYLKQIFDYSYLTFRGVETQFGFVTLVGLPIIQKFPGSKIIIEDQVTLVSTSRGNPAGINHSVILCTLSKEAIIHLKNGSGLSGSSICSSTRVILGEKSGLGANACIYDTDFHPVSSILRENATTNKALSRPVIVGKNVWVAANALILKGVSIGDNAVIGAGAIVTHNVPSNTICAGNPATVVKTL